MPRMPTFTARDGTALAYHLRGAGDPLICVPGGPGLDSGHLGDLGGLSARHELVLLDNRGTGGSATPADPATYRCDHLADDVEALRGHLGLPALDLLGHSAGTNVVLTYAARYPDRVASLVLLNPSPHAVGLEVTADARRAVVAQRANEPWFAPAAAAFERIATGKAGPDDFPAIAPFGFRHWDETTRSYHADCERLRNATAAAAFGAEGAFQPETTRAALSTMDAPVLVVAGGVDLNTPPDVAAALAGLFPNATLATLPNSGHFCWLDDPGWVTDTITAFRERTPRTLRQG